ncbi:basic helix-loop-helix (bHLH) DNA-binding superfamily protein [Rhynchospora pubera]|uniref:Basic helix-loop-helix (BHLH) DNA-binding superfamily protein n=1 Tax=Rhynchospora pubera TaxID=906938 RepID=A0AAV8HBQ3_9POAL|nr:basic helix-loop-helix (bHLH) DNA-binding superfamily protein [Rhynchospora pubera]KAJ4814120.1 basic helix-loop-helix (bHLH) DNA-binding superfamily protein [Rhynchospora pubera]
MAEGGKRVIIASDGSTKANESRTSSRANKAEACRGKKRALTDGDQGGIGSTKIEKGKGKEVKNCGIDNSDHEAHIQTERDRRKRMRNLFTSLQNFHPHLPPKIDKATIVEETVNYIKTLEHTLETLQKQKLDRVRNVFLATQKPLSAASSSTSVAISPEHSVSREAFVADQVSRVPSPLDMVMPLSPSTQQCYNIQTWTSPNVVLSIVGIDACISVCTPKRSGLITATAYFLERHGAEALAVQSYSDSLRTMFIMFARANEATGCFPETPIPADERFKLALGELILWLGSSN